MIKCDDPAARPFTGLCTAVETLVSVFESQDQPECVLYFLRQNGLVTLGSKFLEFPVNMQLSTFKLLQTLIDNVCARDESIAKDIDMALGITAFLQSVKSSGFNEDLKEILAEFLLSLASLMKSTPGLLVRWFEFIESFGGAPVLGTNDDEPDSDKMGFNRQFPMFYIMIDYIYHDGFVGEYARTGLLYLIEVSSKSEQLVLWIIHSDLGSYMASGLGALYSQVWNAVIQKNSTNAEKLVNNEPISTEDGLENDIHLNTFLSYISFWQDLMKALGSQTQTDILQRLVDHFVYRFDAQFVRQILYPSIVESSDELGGYSDLLIELLATILNVLDHNRLSQIIVCYFLGQAMENPVLQYRQKKKERRASQKAEPRPSALLHQASFLENEALVRPSTGNSSNVLQPIYTRPLLTFEDIFRVSLDSPYSDKRARSLVLLSVLISKYYVYVVGKLFPVSSTVPTIVNGQETRPYRPVKIDALEELQTIEQVLKPMVDKDAGVVESCNEEEVYLQSGLLGRYHRENYVTALLQMRKAPSPQPQLLQHLCAKDLQLLETHIKVFKIARPSYPIKVHRINGASRMKVNPNPNDQHTNSHENGKLISESGFKEWKPNVIEKVVKEMLPRFFENGIKENLVLTQIIARLCTCGWIDLRGWFLEELVRILGELKMEYLEKKRDVKVDDEEHNGALDENVLSEHETEHERKREHEPEPGTRRFSWVYSPSSFFSKSKDRPSTPPTQPNTLDPSRSTLLSTPGSANAIEQVPDTTNDLQEYNELDELVESANQEKLNLVTFYEALHEMYSIFIVRAELYDQEGDELLN